MNTSKIALLAVGLLLALVTAPASAAPKKAPKPAPAPAPAPSGPPSASFYEVTETMKLLVGARGTVRSATAALLGTAKVGTPFCPRELAESVMQAPVFCNLTALGKDHVNVQTGLGTFQASIDIVVQGDNPVDGPEFLVGELNVSGKMDFSPALVGGLPYGTVAGTLQGKSFPNPKPAFIGVFRLPFLGSNGGRALCPDTPERIPNVAPDKDYVYLDTTPTGSLTGRCIDITPDELVLGFPTVRFDIWFK